MKKRRLRLAPIFIFILLLSFFLIGGQVFTFVPLVKYSNKNSSSEAVKNYLNGTSKFGFTMTDTIKEIPFQNLLGERYVPPTITHPGPFLLNIDIIDSIDTNYLIINNFLYTCTSMGFLVNIPGVSGSLATKDTECLYVITIEDSGQSTDNFLSVYEHKVRPFVNYLFHSISKLGPQIISINYSNKNGLSFTKHSFNNNLVNCYFGWDSNYSSMDFRLQEADKYLKKHSNKGPYSIIDLRYNSQAVCSNPPPPPEPEKENSSNEPENIDE